LSKGKITSWQEDEAGSVSIKIGKLMIVCVLAVFLIPFLILWKRLLHMLDIRLNSAKQPNQTTRWGESTRAHCVVGADNSPIRVTTIGFFQPFLLLPFPFPSANILTYISSRSIGDTAAPVGIDLDTLYRDLDSQ
jgi:hypothetical protein